MPHQLPRPRILLVPARYLPYQGGVEIHVYEVAKRLAQEGVEVAILTTDPDGRLPREELDNGVLIQRVPTWALGDDYHLAPGIYKTIMRGRWDIVNCVGYHTFVAPLAMLAAWQTGTPYIVTLQSGGHSSRLRYALRVAQWEFLGPLMSHASRLVAISNFEAEFFCRRWRFSREHFVVIPNGSDLPPIEPPQSGRDEALIVSVGRLVRYKGHHRMIAALPKVLAHFPTARLQIAGSGPFEPELRRLAAELNVDSHVDIVCVQGADRVGMARLLSRARLVTLLSEYESQGIAVMEALALGRPVLVTDTSALKEIVARGYARSVPLTASTDEIATAILDQLRRPLIPTVKDLPTWDQCASDLLRLYREVVGLG